MDKLTQAREALIAQIDTLLAINKAGQVSHLVPGLAVDLLTRSRDALAALSDGEAVEPVARKTFPILNSGGARIDYQLVADHGKQARANHFQSVDRLAERGGLSWCELYAVLHNAKWRKMDTNEAMLSCRALETRYLAALASPPDQSDAALRERVAELERALAVAVDRIMETEPGDSRAVSPLAVSLAAVSCGVADDACWTVIDEVARRAVEGENRNG
ncbi:hypothetical protein [Mesorhizobium sp. CAU 1741]|uniref:hypothetical protein n=1 Tax=Mesorhizobium sp. CAU 1741 TaxID=3140366 RepID=UPI00325B2B2D